MVVAHARSIEHRISDAPPRIVDIEHAFANDHAVGERYPARVSLELPIDQDGSKKLVRRADLKVMQPRAVVIDVAIRT